MAKNLGKEIGINRRTTIESRGEFGETNSDFTIPEFFSETLSEYFVNIFIDTKNNAGSSGIYNNPTFGVYGSAKFFDTFVGGFVLGNKHFGVLGETTLGSGENQSVRFNERNVLCDNYELFNDSEFSGTTDSYNWSDTGSLLIEKGETIESSSYTQDVKLTNFKNVAMTVGLSSGNFDDMDFYVSLNNGSNWTQVDGQGSFKNIDSMYRGKDVKWKIVNYTGDGTNVFPLEFPIDLTSGNSQIIDYVRVQAQGENYVGG